MNFTGGTRSYGYFPQSSQVYSMQYLNPAEPAAKTNILKELNYGPADSGGSIQRDLNVLNTCDNDARQTNDFYVGGRLQYYMNEWINLTQRLLNYKSDIKTLNLVNAFISYNDNLYITKKKFVCSQLRNSCVSFNNARHVKEEAYWDYEDTVNADGTITSRKSTYHPAKYWRIEGYNNFNGDTVFQLGAKIEAFEKECGIYFKNPTDWREKLTRE